MYVVAASLVAAVCLGPVVGVAQQGEYVRVEPFLGAQYGRGYVMASQEPAAGQNCVKFGGGTGEPVLVGAGDGGQDSHSLVVTSAADLARSLELSAAGSVKALTSGGSFGFGTKLWVANETQSHAYSETRVYYVYAKAETELPDLSTVEIDPGLVSLLGTLEGRDQFRAQCGDAFVIGIQRGDEFAGTSSIEKVERRASSSTKLEIDVNYDSLAFDAEASLNYISSDVSQRTEEKKSVRVTAEGLGSRPTTPQELEDKWRHWQPSGTGSTIISVVVAPYQVARGYPQEGLLSRPPSEEKLDALVVALWDYKTLLDAAEFILRNERFFALGRHEETRRRRVEWIGSAIATWRRQYDDLKQNIIGCLEDFGEFCQQIFEWHNSTKVIRQIAYLPKRYKSDCTSDIEIRLRRPEEGEALDVLSHSAGDPEMGGGPVLVQAWVRVWPDGSELKMQYRVKLEEDKADRTTFQWRKEWTVFDLRPALSNDDENPLAECVYASGSGVLAPTSIVHRGDDERKYHGYIFSRSSKNPKNYIPFDADLGILRQIECVLDRPTESGDRDKGKVKCRVPEIENFRLALTNKLDEEAEAWQKPELLQPPSSGALFRALPEFEAGHERFMRELSP